MTQPDNGHAPDVAEQAVTLDVVSDVVHGSDEPGTTLLEVTGLTAGYEDLPVLRDVGLEVRAGEVISLVGTNGAGKTTLLSAVMGLLPCWRGTVRFAGTDLTRRPAHAVPGSGLVLVPEGRHLFPYMTVQENLELGAFCPRARKTTRTTLEEVFALFPRLAERRAQYAGSMSGGEQQMCAIGRALMAKPRMLMLDEPSLGLAPIIVEQIFDLIRRLADDGLTILLVEQNVHEALRLADRGYVLDQGVIALSGPADELLARDDLRQTYLGL